MSSEKEEFYHIYNTISFSIKLMQAIEHYQKSESFRHRFHSSIKNVKGEITNYKIVKTLLKTIKKSVPPNQNHTINFVIGSKNIDLNDFIKNYSLKYKPLIVKYDQCRQISDLPKILKGLKKFLHTYGVEDKALIFVGTPKDEEELERIRKLKVEPDKVIILHESSRKNCHDRYLNALKNYYHNQTFDIHGKNMNLLCEKTRKCLTYTEKCFFIPTIWLPRIALIGSSGSGSKSQAGLLANQFNLVLINGDDVISQWCKKHENNTVYDKEYLKSSVIYARLSQPDCLRQGYVLIKFPKTLREFQFLVDFVVKPNKFVFLQAKVSTCLKRIFKRWEKTESTYLEIPSEDLKNIKEYIHKLDSEISKMIAKCQGSKEYEQVDANDNFDTVREKLWAITERTKNM